MSGSGEGVGSALVLFLSFYYKAVRGGKYANYFCCERVRLCWLFLILPSAGGLTDANCWVFEGAWGEKS
jgi:hypothetical protein